MDLAEFLQQLTDERMSVTGRYAKYGIRYELRMTPDNAAICIKWRPAKKAAGMRKNPRLHLIRLGGITSVAELRRAAIRTIDEMIAAENSRLEEEGRVLASFAPDSEESIRLAADMAVWDFR